MRQVFALLLASTLSGGSVAAGNDPEGAALDAGMVSPGYHQKPAWFEESFLDAREDITEANVDCRARRSPTR